MKLNQSSLLVKIAILMMVVILPGCANPAMGGRLATSSPGPTPRAVPSQPAASVPANPAAKRPNPTSTPSGEPATAVVPTRPEPSRDPIIFFTGDLVSAGTVTNAQKVVTVVKNLMSEHPGTQIRVASTGDNEQENISTVDNYREAFGATYGTFVSQGIFMQVRGNHDMLSAGSYDDYDGTVHDTGGAYWDYFDADAHAANVDGQKLTDYSYNLGNWHIVALDQVLPSVNSATLDFLKNDLATNASKACQIVYWHVPTYSSGSGHGDAVTLKALNQVEYEAGVDIQVNGHDHNYQRFYPLNPAGVRDDKRGITTFIDGIGGEDGRSGSRTSIAQPASAVFMDAFPHGEAIGVIQFTLHASSADFAVFDGNSGAIVDYGTIPCH